MKEGARIAVKTRQFEGMATVLYIAPGEIYPVQIELDGGDEDGHKIQRIAWHEIMDERPKKGPGVTFAGPDDATRYIGEVIDESSGYNFKMGERYILGVVGYSGAHQAGLEAKSFYLYDLNTFKFRGRMPAAMFAIIGPYAPEPVPEPEPLKVRIISVSIKKLKKKIMPEPVPEPPKVDPMPAGYSEQLSLF